MSSETRVEAIERTVLKTHEWLAAVQAAMGAPDRRRAWTALRATLHALRDRLSDAEARDLAAQLPMLVRGLFYEGWTGRRAPPVRELDEFLGVVAAEAHDPTLDPERAARAVLGVLAERVSAGEIRDVHALLPAALRGLWPSGRPAGRDAAR